MPISIVQLFSEFVKSVTARFLSNVRLTSAIVKVTLDGVLADLPSSLFT